MSSKIFKNLNDNENTNQWCIIKSILRGKVIHLSIKSKRERKIGRGSSVIHIKSISYLKALGKKKEEEQEITSRRCKWEETIKFRAEIRKKKQQQQNNTKDQ